MVVLLVLATFFFLVLIDFLIIWPIQQSRKARKQNEVEQEIFFTPGVGFTMADGGKPIKKEDNLTQQ